MKIVIVGGGFGGLKLARSLNNKAGFEIVLVDKFNYHQFQPLFYQVATAGLDASNISFPLRKAFQKSKNVRIRLAELQQVVPERNLIITDMEEISYDVLVIATGADTNFFGNQQLAEHSFPMKSTVEALQLRYRLLQNLETALTVKDPDTLARLMNIVVVGGGPTGVEVSGAIAEMKKYILPKEYPELDFSKMNIFLLEGLSKTLANMSEKSSAQSKQYLEKLGVTVMLETMVKDYDGKEAHLNTGKAIPTATLIWAAGVKGNVPDGIDRELVVKGNRIKVDRRSRVLGHSNIYAIGDIAYMETPKFGKGHPQVASVAIQQAVLLAANLRAMESKSNPERILDFEYFDKGSMATVGRNLAVVDIPKPRMHLGGFFAWMIWMGLHLVLLLGVKNKFFVFMNWLYNYFTYDQNLRLIFKEFDRTMKSPASTPKQFKEELVETTER
ncbi:MAG: NAD(P)/FAD-dependent oxidoreductase [Chitinophagaceae bacterium]|nr:MAG: NAD(P)/FAD-dependent oxidoreductase [Chitinophagaceae bacterium]